MKNIWNIRPFRMQNDTDKDGVPDFIDCKPLNPFKHRITPNKLMWQEIEQLPIYVSEKEGEQYHVLSKEAKYKAPRARQEMLSAIKHKPSIITSIKHAYKYEEPSVTEKDWSYTHQLLPTPRTKIAQDIHYELFYTEEHPADPLVRKQKAFKPFIKRAEETETELQRIYDLKYQPKEPSPAFFERLDEMEAFTLGLQVTPEKEIKDHTGFTKKQLLVDPTQYTGPYSGNPKSRWFTEVVQQGTYTYRILRVLSRKTKVINYVKLMNEAGISQGVQGNYTLKQMRNAGLLFQEEKGLYEITNLGRAVLQKVDYGEKWRMADYTKPRAPPSKREQPYQTITPFNITHEILRDIAGVPPSSNDRYNYREYHLKKIREGKASEYGMGREPIPYSKLKKGEGLGSVSHKSHNYHMKKLEASGLIYRPKQGWYRLTRRGWNTLRSLERGSDWHPSSPPPETHELTIEELKTFLPNKHNIHFTITDIQKEKTNIIIYGFYPAMNDVDYHFAVIIHPRTLDFQIDMEPVDSKEGRSDVQEYIDVIVREIISDIEETWEASR